jgi:propanol-preferring alcohol dehydrogenase
MAQIPATQTAAVVPPTGATLDTRLEIKNDRPAPFPAAGELLVKLEFSGVCHSDVHSVRGETPMLTDVAGHEGVGTVVKGIHLPPPLLGGLSRGSELVFD